VEKYGNQPTERELVRRDCHIRGLQRRWKAALGHIDTLRQKQKDISEEMMFFCSAFDQLNKREKLRPWDDPDVQKQYWSEKLRTELNTRLMLKQLPDVELMKSILCLHDDAPVKRSCIEMLNKMNQQQQQALQQNRAQGG
jgi:hypothetical protein